MNCGLVQPLHSEPIQAAELLCAAKDTLDAGPLGIEGAGSDLNLPGRVLFDDRNSIVSFDDAPIGGRVVTGVSQHAGWRSHQSFEGWLDLGIG